MINPPNQPTIRILKVSYKFQNDLYIGLISYFLSVTRLKEIKILKFRKRSKYENTWKF